MGKYKLDKSAQVVEDANYTMTQEEVCERLNELEEELSLTKKTLEFACDEQDLYWFQKHAMEQGVDLVEYLKDYIKEEQNNG